MLIAAAILIFVTGLAHSYLGERYILVRLFRRDNLPALFGGTALTMGTLRFAWHITTVAWWGFAALLIFASMGPLTSAAVLKVVAYTAFASAILPIVFTRGKHLSWVVLLVVGILASASA